MATLTKKEIRLLSKILSGSGLHPASKDALRFRASNEVVPTFDATKNTEQAMELLEENNIMQLCRP